MTDAETPHPLRPLLKNWVWEHGHIGTRYLDCSDGEVKFDEGKKEERVTLAKAGADAFGARAGEPGAAKVDASAIDAAVKALQELK